MEEELAKEVQDHLQKEGQLKAVEDAVKYFEYDLEGTLKPLVLDVAKESGWNIGKVLEDHLEADGKHSQFKEFANECLMRLELLPCLMTICETYQKLYKAFLPQEVALKTGWWKSQRYKLDGLDEKGHSIYFLTKPEEETEAGRVPHQARSGAEQPLLEDEGDLEAAKAECRWLRREPDPDCSKEGKWVASAAKEVGKAQFSLSSPLLTDPGEWTAWDSVRRTSGDERRARLMRVERGGVPIISCNTVRELRECFGSPREVSIQKILDQVRKPLAGLFAEHKLLLEWACELVEAMCDVSKQLDLGNVNKPRARNLDNLFSGLLDLCKLCNDETSIYDKLAEKLRAFGEEDRNKGPLKRCWRYNCRALCLSDLHDSTESFLPRFLHRLGLRSWQAQAQAKVMHVNLETRKAEHSVFKEKREGAIRFVTISDTHGWDADLDLPEDGDVLLHCGNLLFQSGPLAKYNEPPQGLKDLFDLFRRDVRFKRYKAIVIVGGSHDRALFELWLHHPKKLLDMMPKNVVLLQHKSLRESFGVRPPEVAGAGARWEAMEEGAVWLRPVAVEKACEEETCAKLDVEICCASEKQAHHKGWIIAGSGVSVAQGRRRAFQLLDGEREKRRKAATTLLGFQHGHPTTLPDIVLSRGPPKPWHKGDEWDEDRGDYELTESLAKLHKMTDGHHPKVVIFGGGQKFHGIAEEEFHASVEHNDTERKGFAVVGAALTAQFYVPTRPPIFFDEDVDFRLSSTIRDKTGYEKFMDQLQDAAGSVLSLANAASEWTGAKSLHWSLPKFLKKEVRFRLGCGCVKKGKVGCNPYWGLPHMEELPPQQLVAGWIPVRFLPKDVLQVYERKWRKALKKARQAEDANEASQVLLRARSHRPAEGEEPHEHAGDAWQQRAELFTYPQSNAVPTGFLSEELEAVRLEHDVPEAVWKEYIIVVDAQGQTHKAHKPEQLNHIPLPATVYFPNPEEAKKQAQLSEFDVSGPAVTYGQQALLHWIAAPGLTMLAYATVIKPEGGGAFLEYNPLCWGAFGAMFLHLWSVQKTCLSYLVLSQVHVRGSGFSIFGIVPSFTVWMMFIWIVSLQGLMDISAQCLFYGQFLASVEANPVIGKVWKLTIVESFEATVPLYRNITELFTVCWLMMFAQLGYLLLHVFPMDDKMRYDMGEDETTGSMPQGYTTLMSMMMGSEITVDAAEIEDSEDTDLLWLGTLWLGLRNFFWKCKITLLEVLPNLRELFSSPHLLRDMVISLYTNFATLLGLGREKTNKKRFKFWHADIVRVLATYGRMTALTWSEKSLVQKRLEKELDKEKNTPNVARFFQILFNRAKDFLMRAILIDILEKALKLEIQISVFSIDFALQHDQSSKWRACNKQMLFAIFLSFMSAIYALWSQSQTCRSLFRLLKRCEDQNMGGVHYKNLPGTRKSMKAAQRTLWCYCLCLIVLGLFIFHCVMKVIMAFTCEFAVWNWKGCVCFHHTGDVANRTLILDNTSSCILRQ